MKSQRSGRLILTTSVAAYQCEPAIGAAYMAAKAGAAESARFLAGHTEWFLRLGAPGGYSPERLLERTGAALASPASAVEGLHLFTFNQVRQTEEWRRTLLDRLSAHARP